MFKNWDWEDRWIALIYGLIVFTAIGGAVFLFSTRKTKGYSLGTNENGHITITKEIENGPDDEIRLDRSVTYSQAIALIDSLNLTLKNK